MQDLKIPISDQMMQFLKVFYSKFNNVQNETESANKQKLRRKTTMYISQRYKQKHHKFSKKEENSEFTYKEKTKKEKKEPTKKEKKEPTKKEKKESSKLEKIVCLSCGKVYADK